MALFAILIHGLINFLFGFTVLRISGSVDSSNKSLWIVEAFLIGAFVETMIGFILMLFGFNELIALYTIAAVAIINLAYLILKKKLNLKPKISFRLDFKPLEYLLLLPILAKVLLAVYQTIKHPIYYDDAMTHWSGRAHALFAKINWSVNPESEFFLGKAFGFSEYPLFTVIWKSISAGIINQWDDIIGKADSLIFYICLLYSVYVIIKGITKNRLYALASCLAVTTVPLIDQHASAGYSEIIITLLVVVIFNCIVHKSFFKAGLFTALAIWTKNEGLFIIIPSACVSIFVVSILFDTFKIKTILKVFVKFFSGILLSIAPWLAFKLYHGLKFSVISNSENYYHDDALMLWLKKIFNSPSALILWIVFLLFFALGFNKWRKQIHCTVAISFILTCLLLLTYVFCFTSAHKFLINDMTPFRSLLQVSPLAIICISLITFQSTKFNAIEDAHKT